MECPGPRHRPLRHVLAEAMGSQAVRRAGVAGPQCGSPQAFAAAVGGSGQPAGGCVMNPTPCATCDPVHSNTRKQSYSQWGCVRFPKLAGLNPVDPNGWVDPPYMRCV